MYKAYKHATVKKTADSCADVMLILLLVGLTTASVNTNGLIDGWHY